MRRRRRGWTGCKGGVEGVGLQLGSKTLAYSLATERLPGFFQDTISIPPILTITSLFLSFGKFLSFFKFAWQTFLCIMFSFSDRTSEPLGCGDLLTSRQQRDWPAQSSRMNCTAWCSGWFCTLLRSEHILNYLSAHALACAVV